METGLIASAMIHRWGETARLYSGLSSLLRFPPVAYLRKTQQTGQSAVHFLPVDSGYQLVPRPEARISSWSRAEETAWDKLPA